MDSRETWLLTDPASLLGDLEKLVESYAALKDCPNLWELERFPSWEEARAGVLLNRAYKHHADLRGQVRLHEGDYWREASSKAESLCYSWEHLRDATCDSYWVTQRRLALRHLRESIGIDSFYSGRMPTPYPLQFFESRP